MCSSGGALDADVWRGVGIGAHLESGMYCMYLPSVVGPATELEFAFLIIKREPCNVYLARALKDARRDVEAAPSLVHHHVRLERAVELFVGAVLWVAEVVVVEEVVVVVVVAAAEEGIGWLVVSRCMDVVAGGG